jgi:hypothetical protein
MKTWYWKLSMAIVVIVATVALTLVGASAAAAPPATQSTAETAAPTDATYTWSAELVGFDAASNTVTVRAMLVSVPEANDLPKLHAGDRAVLTWSGLSTAAGVRAVQKGDKSSFDRMTMPIEFVSSELDGRYMTFKVPIPAANAAAIAKLAPGAYVTATSPLRAKSAADAVISIKPYNDVS